LEKALGPLWLRIVFFVVAAVGTGLWYEQIVPMAILLFGIRGFVISEIVTLVAIVIVWWRLWIAIIRGGRFWSVEWPPHL
jgi:hypothetical protein